MIDLLAELSRLATGGPGDSRGRGHGEERTWLLELVGETARSTNGLAPPLAAVLSARVARVQKGSCDLAALVADPGRWLGLMILDGWLLVQLETGRAQSGWLLGREDVTRPWELDEVSTNAAAAWRALSTTRLALLDEDFCRRAGGIPSVMRELLSRAARTSHWLLAKSLIISSPLIEERLALLFALWAERWGKVTLDGVRIDVPVSHSTLAHLCGSRRPTVTTTLGSLHDEGAIIQVAHGSWLLPGRPASPA